MIESPLIKELADEARAEGVQEVIVSILRSRFGEVPEDLLGAVRSLSGKERLSDAAIIAAQCPDLEAFRVHLRADGG